MVVYSYSARDCLGTFPERVSGTTARAGEATDFERHDRSIRFQQQETTAQAFCHGTARALHCTALHCTALHCTALHWTAMHDRQTTTKAAKEQR